MAQTQRFDVENEAELIAVVEATVEQDVDADELASAARREHRYLQQEMFDNIIRPFIFAFAETGHERSETIVDELEWVEAYRDLDSTLASENPVPDTLTAESLVDALADGVNKSQFTSDRVFKLAQECERTDEIHSQILLPIIKGIAEDGYDRRNKRAVSACLDILELR